MFLKHLNEFFIHGFNYFQCQQSIILERKWGDLNFMLYVCIDQKDLKRLLGAFWTKKKNPIISNML